MSGAQIYQTEAHGLFPPYWNIVGQRDFNGDGKYDLLWRNNSGKYSIISRSANRGVKGAKNGGRPSAGARRRRRGHRMNRREFLTSKKAP